MTLKVIAACGTSLLGLAFAAAFPPEPPDGPRDLPKAKKKGEEGPAGDLRKAYDMLRRVRAGNRSTGRPEERLRDWTERATKLYRDGIRAYERGDTRLAHEYGAAAHDLGRAVDHARNASLEEEPDVDLPPPPDRDRGGDGGRARVDLRRAYERIRFGLDAWRDQDAKFYLDAARDLYNAARRDATAGRDGRAGELARAAEAITHVPEHLSHAADQAVDARAKTERYETKPSPRPFDDEPKAKRKGEPDRKRPPRPEDDRPEPERDRDNRELPPPL
jgi:hypothetical protein